MNVLMMCYYYPPINDVGSKRSVAFSKYFKKHGWQPYVLSVKNPDKTYCSVGKDLPPNGVHTEYCYSVINYRWLLGKLNGALAKILKLIQFDIPRNYFYDLVCYPDHFLGWIPLATIRGARMIKEYKIDFIYVSCSPFSAALAGVFLKKIMKKPLVLDFRDPLNVGISTYINVSKLRRNINRWFEKLFIKYVDILFVTSDETRQEYVKIYPRIKERIFTVHNGFDPVFSQCELKKKYDRFSVVYTGQFYTYMPNHQKYTDMFFRALAYLKLQGDISNENFQFQFFGDEYEYVEDLSEKYDVKDLVIAKSRVPYQKILEHISRSHLMLLRIVKLMISTKLYEGIPLNTPFLATIPHGEVEDIIRIYSPGSIILTEDNSYKDVANSIKDAIEKYKNGKMQNNLVEEFLIKFRRENLAIKLMNIVEKNLKQKDLK
jgi:glycosyltransferase involved in cell wall biosynthesis